MVLYAMQDGIVRNFGSIEGYSKATKATQQEYLDRLDRTGEIIRLQNIGKEEQFGMKEEKLAMMAMYQLLTGIKNGYMTQSGKLGGVIAKHSLHPKFLKDK